MTSLSLFCKTYKLPKATVHRDCQRLNIDSSNGLDDEAVKKLIAEYGLEELPAPGRIVVEKGNHRTEKDLPVLVAGVNLERFRTHRERATLANRHQFVRDLEGFLDQIEEGMVLAEAEQEQELQEIREIKRRSQRRIDQFRRRADEYRIKTDILATIQNAELDDLEEITEEANGLGKPGGGA